MHEWHHAPRAHHACRAHHAHRARVLCVATAAACTLAVAGFAPLAAQGAGANAAAPTTASALAPTYRDVAPIFRAKCASCHVLGGIASFPLGSARDAVAHAQEILIVTRSGQMPPWPPGKDSPAFIGQSKRVLTSQEKDAIARWVRGGAKR